MEEGGGVPQPFYAKLHVSISECIIVFLSKRYMPPLPTILWLCDFETLWKYPDIYIQQWQN